MKPATSNVTLASLTLCFSDKCLGPGFTRVIPPQNEQSHYSTTVLQSGDRAIYTTLSFRCNGVLESLTIPSKIRGSVYPYVDNTLEPRPSIWRFNETGLHLVFESFASLTTFSSATRELQPEEVLSFNFTVVLQMNIQAGDVLGFQALISRKPREEVTVIEHLPLLYKPGSTPGSYIPVIIANFEPKNDEPATGEFN